MAESSGDPDADSQRQEDHPYTSPPPEDVRRRNLITGALLVLFILVIVGISVWSRV
jgi:hypothetical protein